jgi:hypothetical protein
VPLGLDACRAERPKAESRAQLYASQPSREAGIISRIPGSQRVFREGVAQVYAYAFLAMWLGGLVVCVFVLVAGAVLDGFTDSRERKETERLASGIRRWRLRRGAADE